MHQQQSLNRARGHSLTHACLIALFGHLGVALVARRAVWALAPGRDPVAVLVWVDLAAVGVAAIVFFGAGRIGGHAAGGTARATLVPAGVGLAPFVPGVLAHAVAYGRVAGMVPGLFAVTVLHMPVLTAAMWLGVRRTRGFRVRARVVRPAPAEPATMTRRFRGRQGSRCVCRSRTPVRS